MFKGASCRYMVSNLTIRRELNISFQLVAQSYWYSIVLQNMQFSNEYCLNQLNHTATRGPKGHCRSPEYNQRFKNLTSELNQKQQHFILHVSRSLLCIQFVAITFWAEEVLGMCHLLWWIDQGGNFYLLLGPKNTNLVEDIKILLPLKFRWIPFSGFRGKVKICLRQSQARAAILFFRSARKTQTW